MDDQKPWMQKIFSKSELNELLRASEKILWDDDNGIVINISLSNNQCMDFVHHWHISRDNDDAEISEMIDSVAHIEDFLLHMALFLENHLYEEDPDWPDRYYGNYESDAE